MGSFILFLVIIVLAIIGLGFMFVFRVVRILTRGPKVSSFGDSNNDNEYKNSNNKRNAENHNHEKIFSKDEGEYVDYEEIK